MDEDIKVKIDILECTDDKGSKGALQDLISLSGALKVLQDESFWHETRYVFETLRVLKIILDATNSGQNETLSEVSQIIYRYERIFGESPQIDIPRFIRLCVKFNWVTDPVINNVVKFNSDGKRMVISLFHIINDWLSFHMQPNHLKRLYLAQRDIELAGAYEDHGIGGVDVLFNIVSSLEDAISDIKIFGEKYIDQGLAIENHDSVREILNKLEAEIERRYNERLIEAASERDSIKLQNIYQRSAVAIQKTVSILASYLGDISNASQHYLSRIIQVIDKDKFLNYLIDVYSENINKYTLDPITIMQNIEWESLNSSDIELFCIYVPFSLTPIIYENDVKLGTEELDNWILNYNFIEEESPYIVEYEESKVISIDEYERILSRKSVLDKVEFDTAPMVNAIKDFSGEYLDYFLEKLNTSWSSTINNMLMLSVLNKEKEVELLQGHNKRLDISKSKEWVMTLPNDKEVFIHQTQKLGNHLKIRGM